MAFVCFGCGTLVAMVVLTAQDQVRAREMLRVLGDHPRISTEDGTLLDLPAPVAEALTEMLEAAADGGRVLVLRAPAAWMFWRR